MFGTVEMLELILIKLSPVEILLDQRVSREWLATVEGSKKLQQKLFFKPTSDAQTNCLLQGTLRYPLTHRHRGSLMEAR